MVAREDDPPGEAKAATEWRFCCLFKEYVVMESANKQTRAVCAESYRGLAARHEPCTTCQYEIEASQQHCGNPFGTHRQPFRRKLQRVDDAVARRIPLLATCKFVCIYCLCKAKMEQKKRREDRHILQESKGKIKNQLQSMGLCKDDVRQGIIQIMKKPYVELSRMQTNYHWENSKNHLSIKDVPQADNYDSSDSHDQRSLCSYDGDVEETNDCEDIVLQDHYKESYTSDSSLAISRVESTSKNINSEPSSSLQVNFNIKQNLFTSRELKSNDSKTGRNSNKLKKRYSLPAVQGQYMYAKRSRSFSEESPKKEETSSSLKLTIKRDHVGEYRISSQSVQTESRNFVKIVDVNSNGNCTSSNFTNKPTSAENKSLVKKNSDSTESISKLKVHIDKAVPELELNDTRPVNMPVNRNNLENSLSTFLKSKLKRNLKDDAEVESKRQKITDESVAVNINVNITVNPVLESSVQNQKPLKLVSSNDNSKMLLPKTRTNICSTSDFSSCNESDDERSICSKLNSNIGQPKNLHIKNLESETNTEMNTNPVKSPQEILQVDHNSNIEKQLSMAKNVSLKNSEEKVKISEKSKTKHQQNISVNGNLKLVFKNLFGDVSDTSETEEEIYKKKRRKSSEYKKNQSTSGIAASIEKSQSESEKGVLCIATQDKLQLTDLHMCSLKTAAIENKGVDCKTEISKEELLNKNKPAEISSLDSNVQFAKLLEGRTFISNIQIQKQNHLNNISLDKNIPTQIHEFEAINDSEAINSNITDKNILEQSKELEESCETTISCSIDQNNPKQIDEHIKSSGSEKTNSNITGIDHSSSKETANNISKQVDEYEKSSNSEEICIVDDFSSKDQVMPDSSQTYDEVDLEGGDFEFISSIQKIINSNGYSDDEYNDYSDFDAEYDGSNNIEYSSDVELIENHKELPSNKNVQNTINDKSYFSNTMTSKQESKIHNLNELPPFYHEDVTNIVKRDIDIDDEDIVILDDLIKNDKNNLPANKNIKSESIINLDSDEEIIDINDEITVEEINEELSNEVINNRLSLSNNVSNVNIESASEVYQSTETSDNNLEIKNTTRKLGLGDCYSNISELDLGTSVNKETGSSVTLTCEEKEVSKKLPLEANTTPTSSATENRNISGISLDTSLHSFIDNVLQPSSDPNEKSTPPNESVIDFSENILNSNSETVFSNSLIIDYSEDSLDVGRDSVSPDALVIDESAENDESNIDSENLTTEFDQSVSNEEMNSEALKMNVNSDNGKEVDEMQSSHTSRFSGNVSNDLNNPSILQEFNLSRESVAPEEIKSEPVVSDDNNIEQQICENLLEEFKNNTFNKQEQNDLSIKVTEAPHILINQSDSNNVLSSNIVIEVTRENSEKFADRSNDWMDIDDLNKKGLKTLGPFKCRNINELLEKPVNKNTESNVIEASNLEVQKSTPSEIPSSTNNLDSTINIVLMQNQNSINQINQQNNLIIGTTLIQTNVSQPISMLSGPINQLAGVVNKLPPIQACVPQQMQPVLNTVNTTLVPQCTPQTIILNSVQNNQNSSQGNVQSFTSAISNNVQSQNLSQGNPQTFTPAMSNNIQSQNVPQGNSQTFTSAISNTVQSQNLPQGNSHTLTSPPSNNVQKIFASSMFTNMFAPRNALPSISSISQTTRLNANFSTEVPKEHYVISTLPLPPTEAIGLPKPLSVKLRENQTSVSNKVHTFRRIVLRKIETELNFLRIIPINDLITYYDVLTQRKKLTKEIWKFQLSIINLTKCTFAMKLTTTANMSYNNVVYAIVNSLKPSETPQMQGALKLIDVLQISKFLGITMRFNYCNMTDCASPVLLELQALQDQNHLEQTVKSMSEKQKEKFEIQVKNYIHIFKTHQEQVNLLKPNYNVESLYQNNSLTVRPVNVATISSNSTTQNSLQKSLNNSKKKQSTLSTGNVTVQKKVDKAKTNNAEISVTTVRSKKKETNTESILDNLNSSCLKCKKPSEIACSDCLSVAYCSRECQYNHWKEIHHETCKRNLKGIEFL